MSETIWRATDADGRCWLYGEKPDWSEHQFYSQDGRVLEYYGTEKPPPGECWEIVQTRKGSQPSGEAWERLLNVVADYVRNVGIVGPRGERIKEAWKAYEAAQSAEPSDQQATIEVLTKELSISDQVIDERNATIAELRSELDETRTERHAYKSRLREFCQRLVDMVGAEGPEDVQGMLDKVNAELHRLKQNIDSMSANLADKEGFLNSAGDEIERLTKERDELRVTIDLDRANWDRVQDANYRTIAELQARLAKPEMPECVRELLEWAKSEDLNEPAKQIAAVEAHYAPPFKVDKPGWYLASDGKEWRVAEIDGDTAWGRNGFVWYGFSTKRVASSLLQLTKFLRPLEG